MIASREQTLPFQTKIFLTVFLVALVPVFLCFAMLLPALVSTSAAGQRDAANEQLALLTGRMEQVLSGMKTALDELAEDERILPALSKQDRVQPRELYAALVEQAAAMPEVSQLMLVDESGTCLCALRGQEEDAHRDTDWGALRMAQGEQVVFYSELGRIAAVRRAQTGYLLAEISGDDLGELLSDGLNPSYGVMLLSRQWRLIDDSKAIGSEGRLHELRERLLAGMPLEDKDSVLTYSYAVEGIGGFTLLLSQPRVFTGEMTRLMLVVGCSLGALSLALCLWGALVLSRTADTSRAGDDGGDEARAAGAAERARNAARG